jgi:hypothetical protein
LSISRHYNVQQTTGNFLLHFLFVCKDLNTLPHTYWKEHFSASFARWVFEAKGEGMDGIRVKPELVATVGQWLYLDCHCMVKMGGTGGSRLSYELRCVREQESAFHSHAGEL